MKLKKLLFVCVATAAALMGWSCEEDNTQPPVNLPTIGIHEPEFDKASMTLKALIAPSSDATAWYWSITAQGEEATYTKVDNAAADEVSATVEYGVEYTIAAYAENEAGVSEVATKRYCPMPDAAEVAIGEVTLDEATMTAKCTIYPSTMTTAWYWKATTAEEYEATEWQKVEGNTECEVSFAYTWGEKMKLYAYAENAAGKSDERSIEVYFEPEAAALTLSEPEFDSATMKVTLEVTPSATTAVWYWRMNPDGETNEVVGNEATTLSFDIEYDTTYNISLHAENILGKSAEGYIVEFCYAATAMVEIEVAKATAYTLDVDVTKSERCSRYVVGAVASSFFDAEVFTTQAQSSLNPDPNYPFIVYNSATESATFTEQNLVRNSKADSTENSGIVLIQGEKYTIAVYAEDGEGRGELYTIEHTVPVAVEGSDFGLKLTMSEEQIGMTWAKASVEAPAGSKLLVGLMDYTITENDEPFTFEGKSDEECKAYILASAFGKPAVVSESKEYTLSEMLLSGTNYVAYAVAVDPSNEVINVAYNIFTTVAPALTGKANITKAYISTQTSLDKLSVLLYVDSAAKKTRLYAAPATDHGSYADHMEQIMAAEEYQNYREEYSVANGMSLANIEITHPGANYYIYAVAIDKDGKAGAMVNVAQLAGGTEEYYTTATEIEEKEDDDSGDDSGEGGGNTGNIYDKFFVGTGSVEIAAEVVDDTDPDAISVKFTLVSKSDNVKGVWLHRINEGKTKDVKEQVLNDFAGYGKDDSYPTGTSSLRYRNLITYTSYTEESMISYDDSYGGTIITVVVADTDDKISINYCYIAGVGETEL